MTDQLSTPAPVDLEELRAVHLERIADAAREVVKRLGERPVAECICPPGGVTSTCTMHVAQRELKGRQIFWDVKRDFVAPLAAALNQETPDGG